MIFFIKRCLFWGMIGCLLFSGSAMSAEKLRPLQIEPIPNRMTMKPKVVSPESEGRSSTLTQGIIDRIDGKEIVITDALRTLPANVEIYSASGSPMSMKSLKAGQRIRYRLGSDNQVAEIRLLKQDTGR